MFDDDYLLFEQCPGICSQEDLSGQEEFYTRILDQKGSHVDPCQLVDPFAELNKENPCLADDCGLVARRVKSRAACAILAAQSLDRDYASIAPDLFEPSKEFLELKAQCDNIKREALALNERQLKLKLQHEELERNRAELHRQYNWEDPTQPVVRSRFVRKLMQAQAYDELLPRDRFDQSFDDLEPLFCEEEFEGQSFFHVPVANAQEENGSDLFFADQGQGFDAMNQMPADLVPVAIRRVNIPRLRLVQHLAQAPIDVEEPELARCFFPQNHVAPVSSLEERDLGYQAENDSPLLPMSQD